MLTRRTALASGALAALATPLPALAQGRKDSVTLALVLEPPGLDPTAGAASSIAVGSPWRKRARPRLNQTSGMSGTASAARWKAALAAA